MKHLAAYCLLVLGGNATPSEDDVAKLMKEVGVAVDKDNLKTMIAQIGDKKVHEHIAEGRTKMASVSAAPAAASGNTATAAAASEEKPAEEEKKEEEEEVDADMGGLFGDEDEY